MRNIFTARWSALREAPLLHLLLALLWCAAAPGADGELALVRDGASAFTVVHAADAPASVRTAARELRE